MIEIIINDQKVQVEEGCTILDAANKIGVDIPSLCHHPKVEPYGACRLCTVEIHDGQKMRMVTACNYSIRGPVQVNTNSEKTVNMRKILIQMMMSRWPNVSYIKEIAKKYQVPEPDYTHPLVDYNEHACVLCGLCIRMCKLEGKIGDVMGFSGRGASRAVKIPYEQRPDECQECQKCAAVCPTWAINITTEFVKIKDKIAAVMESGPKSIPEVAKAINLPLAVVTYNIMSLRKFGFIAETDEPNDDDYYLYDLKK